MGIVLSSCASYSQRVGDIQAHLYNNNPKEAITALEKKIPNANDLVLRDLNLAILNDEAKQLEFKIDGSDKRVTIGALIPPLLILDMDTMMYELRMDVNVQYSDVEVVGFGKNEEEKKYILFIKI